MMRFHKEIMMNYEAEYAFLGMVGDVLNNRPVRFLPEGVTVDDIITIGKGAVALSGSSFHILKEEIRPKSGRISFIKKAELLQKARLLV